MGATVWPVSCQGGAICLFGWNMWPATRRGGGRLFRLPGAHRPVVVLRAASASSLQVPTTLSLHDIVPSIHPSTQTLGMGMWYSDGHPLYSTYIAILCGWIAPGLSCTPPPSFTLHCICHTTSRVRKHEAFEQPNRPSSLEAGFFLSFP